MQCKGFREQVWRYGWDGEDRLVECFTPKGERYTYAYDPFGRRVAKQAWVKVANRASTTDPEWERSQKTLYFWDGDVLARESLVNAEGETLREAKWHFEPESFVPIAKQEGDQLWYVVTDHLGTPRELLSEEGSLVWAAEFGTWGGVRRLWQADNDNEAPSRGDLQGYDFDGNPVYAARFQTSGNLALKPLDNPDPLFCPIRFQGQWADEETGLYYNRFRYYDPLSAQYMSPDPIGINGGLNSQTYVHNPGSWIDPLGLASRKKCCDNPCGRSGKQARLKELANDPKLGRSDRGWLKQEMNAIDSGSVNSRGNPKVTIRNPPGKDLAHQRGREAAKGYSYRHSDLQDRDLHRLQHKHDDYGRKNAERPVDDDC